MKQTARRGYRLNKLGKVTVFSCIMIVVLAGALFFTGRSSSETINVPSAQVISLNKPSEHSISLAGRGFEIARFQETKNGPAERINGMPTFGVVPPLAVAKAKEKEQPVFPQKANKAPLETGKVVYLTFDDGPFSQSEAILSLLETYQAKATFFMLEPNMRKHKSAVKRMAAEGHAVGVHSVSHDVKKVYRSPDAFVKEMETARATLKELSGVDSRLVRAPYGSKPYLTAPYLEASRKMDYIIWDWNVDSTDWKLRNGEYVKRVIQGSNSLTGKRPLIVLLHEKPSTLAHLEKILKHFQKNGYEMRALNESMTPVQFK